MSRGKWQPLACPDGYRERAELAARLEDVAARLSATARDVGILSQLVRQLEERPKRDRNTKAA